MYGTVPSGGAFDLVVVAASQGGLAASRQVLAALPREFPAAVIVLQHRPPSGPDWLPGLLSRQIGLPVRPAGPGQRPQAGTVYVALADCQLLLDSEGRFATAELETRLALADPLLCSAATAVGARAIAVVLSGRLKDGAAGAWDALIAIRPVNCGVACRSGIVRLPYYRFGGCLACCPDSPI